MVEMIQGEAKLFKSLKEQKTYVQYIDNVYFTVYKLIL